MSKYAKIRHDFEGLYECRLSNIRGGTILRTVSSYGIYVFAKDPPPLKLKVGYVVCLRAPSPRLAEQVWFRSRCCVNTRGGWGEVFLFGAVYVCACVPW